MQLVLLYPPLKKQWSALFTATSYSRRRTSAAGATISAGINVVCVPMELAD